MQPVPVPARPVDAGRERLSLGLGAAVVVDRPTVVRTVLGSCVAVIFHVPRLGLSALCHAQMPERDGRLCCRSSCPKPCGSSSADSNDLRYVTCCIRYMLAELQRRWVDKAEIVCTLVGGANVIRNIDPRWSVGERNVNTALQLLQCERIKIHYRDTGGTRGRVIEHLSDVNRTKVRYHDSAA
jgi:chemotaxis protein CheD